MAWSCTSIAAATGPTSWCCTAARARITTTCCPGSTGWRTTVPWSITTSAAVAGRPWAATYRSAGASMSMTWRPCGTSGGCGSCISAGIPGVRCWRCCSQSPIQAGSHRSRWCHRPPRPGASDLSSSRTSRAAMRYRNWSPRAPRSRPADSGPAGSGGLQQATLRARGGGYFHDPRRAKDLTPFRITGRTQQEVWNSLGEDFDLRPALARLDISAIVVHGDDDPIPLTSATATAEALHAPLVVLPECGHVPYVEAPDAFVAALDPFLPSE